MNESGNREHACRPLKLFVAWFIKNDRVGSEVTRLVLAHNQDEAEVFASSLNRHSLEEDLKFMRVTPYCAPPGLFASGTRIHHIGVVRGPDVPHAQDPNGRRRTG